MTITTVVLQKETGGLNVSGGMQYERVYQVGFTGGYSVAAFLYNTNADLPKPGDEHPEDDDAIVTDTKPELEADSPADAGLALYTVTYGPKPAQGWDPDPMSRPPEISWGGGIGITETADKDVDDDPIVNSANQLYSPLPERPVRGGRCTITRNESSNPATRCVTYSFTTNAASWNGVAIGNAMFEEITATQQSEIVSGALVTYWKVTYPIKFNRKGWTFKAFDNGYRTITDDDTYRNATDDVGNASPTPVLLDGAGGELAPDGTPVVYPTDGYQVLEETAWGTLSLPNPFA